MKEDSHYLSEHLVCWLHNIQIETLCPSDFSKWNANVLAVSEWSVLNQIGFSEIILSDFIEFNVNYNCAIFHMQIHILSQKGLSTVYAKTFHS
jgi:hypothetical protein